LSGAVHERGMRVRREVLGDDHVDAAVARTTEFTADFQDLITHYAWGRYGRVQVLTAGRAAPSP
jgi:3-oxoadipate enol-lactonase/4-carboxymuconolactone decarboxylase